MKYPSDHLTWTLFIFVLRLMKIAINNWTEYYTVKQSTDHMWTKKHTKNHLKVKVGYLDFRFRSKKRESLNVIFNAKFSEWGLLRSKILYCQHSANSYDFWILIMHFPIPKERLLCLPHYRGNYCVSNTEAIWTATEWDDFLSLWNEGAFLDTTWYLHCK